MRKVTNMNLKIFYRLKFEEGWDIDELASLAGDSMQLSIKVRCGQLNNKDADIIENTPKELIYEVYKEWSNGKNGKSVNVDGRINEIKGLLEIGYTQKEIMLKTGYTRRLVSEVAKAWVKEGHVEVKETKQKEPIVKESEVKKTKKMSKKCLANIKALEEKRLLEEKQREEESKKLDTQEVEIKSEDKLVEPKEVESTGEPKKVEEVVLNKNGIPKGKRMTLQEFGEACGYIKEKDVEPIEKQELVVHVEDYQGGIKKDMVDYKRGDVVFVYNDAYSRNNGIIGKSRPALIIQNDSGNYYSDNVIVCYITSVLKKHNLPTHVYSTDTECLRDSMIMTEQIQTVSKQFISYMGRISDKEMVEVEKALVVSFGLNKYIGNLIDKECHRRGKLDLELVGYEMLKASGEVACIEEEVQEPVVEEVREEVKEEVREEEVKEPVGVIKPFKGLKVNELESDKYTYRINGALEITRKEKGQEENVIADIDSVINDLMEIKNYLLNQ